MRKKTVLLLFPHFFLSFSRRVSYFEGTECRYNALHCVSPAPGRTSTALLCLCYNTSRPRHGTAQLWTPRPLKSGAATCEEWARSSVRRSTTEPLLRLASGPLRLISEVAARPPVSINCFAPASPCRLSFCFRSRSLRENLSDRGFCRRST